MVDKAKRATEIVTFDKFRLHRSDRPEGLLRLHVEYLGDVERLRNEHLLAFLDVASEVAEIETEVTAAADELAATLRSEPIVRVAPELGQKCKRCEFRLSVDDARPNGFRECWGALADAIPHVLDLYRVDLLGGKNRDVVRDMAATGKARLTEIPDGSLQGIAAVRQQLQIQCTRDQREFISKELGQAIAGHSYPLHFIDFEGSRFAIPYHVGMHPYELAAFQWSCHSIPAPGGPVDHAGWLNTDEAFPNFNFARTLRDRVGEGGTVYTWSHYEVDVLREIREQMDDYQAADPSLAAWLDRMITRGNPRVVDLCALAKDHYFHPVMHGSLSIKDVMRAAWHTNEALRVDPAFARYVRFDGQGHLLDPYQALPPFPIGGKEEAITEGTGPMRVYQEMMFGLARDDHALRNAYRRLLLQYCELDTAAMVFIWRHWSLGG